MRKKKRGRKRKPRRWRGGMRDEE
jgi:hypothetical protein